MKKIKKIATSFGVVGKVLNAFSNSTENTYCCDYINNKLKNTQWTNLTDNIKYCKSGNIVTIQGLSRGTQELSAGENIMGILPEEFRPNVVWQGYFSIPFKINTTSLEDTGYIGTDGTLLMYTNTATSWWNFIVSYPVF